MDYKITCVCGHQFVLPEERVRAGEVYCPVCKQRLNPTVETPPLQVTSVTAAAPAPATADHPAAAPVFLPASTMSPAVAPATPFVVGNAPGFESTKRCPYCGEIILAIARKCKHCGEFLDRPAPPPGPAHAHYPAAPQTGTMAVPTHAAPSTALATTTQPPATADEHVFELTTSQWDNFWKYLMLFGIVFFIIFVCSFFTYLRENFLPLGVLGSMVIGGAVAWFYYYSAKSTRLTIHPFHLEIERGILSKQTTSLELFRITDIELEQNLLQRLLGFGTVKLTTTDADSPILLLRQIPRAREVRQYLQTQVPLAARIRGAVYMEK